MTAIENPYVVINKLQRELGLKRIIIDNQKREMSEIKALKYEIETLKTENQYLKTLLKISTKTTSVQAVIEAAIGEVYPHFLPSMIKSKNRKSELVELRHMWMHLMYKFSGMTLMKIAEIANRDHSTIIHAVQKVDGFCLYDKQYKQKYEKVLKIVTEKLKINSEQQMSGQQGCTG